MRSRITDKQQFRTKDLAPEQEDLVLAHVAEMFDGFTKKHSNRSTSKWLLLVLYTTRSTMCVASKQQAARMRVHVSISQTAHIILFPFEEEYRAA